MALSDVGPPGLESDSGGSGECALEGSHGTYIIVIYIYIYRWVDTGKWPSRV